MLSKVCLDRKGFCTLVADEGALPRVHSAHVATKNKRSIERFSAVGAFVRGGGDVTRSVDSFHVHDQITIGSESFVAVGAGVRSLAGVGSHVRRELIRADESGATSL